MGERGEYSRKRRSRRRKGSRSREIFMAFLALMFMAALAVGAVTGGVCGYRYWQGSRTSGLPLEVSREVEAETMGEEK